MINIQASFYNRLIGIGFLKRKLPSETNKYVLFGKYLAWIVDLPTCKKTGDFF